MLAMAISSWISTTGAVLGFMAVMTWRVQEGRTAVTLRKIVIPPLGMASGLGMFAFPSFRVPSLWAAGAFLVGALVLAYPLIRTSRLTLQGDVVMVRRSNWFFVVMAGLALVRLLGHSYLNKLLSVQQTAALFFLLAFGMTLCWRTSLFFEYRRITCEAPAHQVEELVS